MAGKKRYSRIVCLLITTICSLMLASCAEEDVLRPVTGDDMPVATTPDQLAENLATAISDRDSQAYDDLLAEDFSVRLDPSDIFLFGLPTDYLNRQEMRTAAANLFSGESFVDFTGASCGAVEDIRILAWEPLGDAWTEEEAGVFAGLLKRRYLVRLAVDIAGQTGPLEVEEILYLYAVGTVIDDEMVYRLGGLADTVLDSKSAVFHGWGGVCARHLTVTPPVAALQVTDLATYPAPSALCDAGASADPVHGLHDQAYRWRFDEGPWTAWSEAFSVNGIWADAGLKTVAVEVRNRWLVSAGTSRDIEVTLGEPDYPAATTPDQLMANFRDIYENMDYTAFSDRLMHPDFKIMLQQDTVDEFALPLNYFTYEQELAIQQHIFSGEPVETPYGPVPGVTSISFTTFEQQAAWTVAPPNHPSFPNALYTTYRVRAGFVRNNGASTTLIVQGYIQVYVTEIEQDGETLYRLIGMVDLTDGKAKATENCCWGQVQALYR